MAVTEFLGLMAVSVVFGGFMVVVTTDVATQVREFGRVTRVVLTFALSAAVLGAAFVVFLVGVNT